ncbi:MAG: acyl carrier protein [Clostridia bacterium]|nr:acyl carrier protein [Clostridia bacterium]
MVFEKIRAMIAEQLEIEEESITMDSALIEDLGADSLDVVDLVMSIEDEFEIEVPDEAIENMRTIGDAVRFIEGTK